MLIFQLDFGNSILENHHGDEKQIRWILTDERNQLQVQHMVTYFFN